MFNRPLSAGPTLADAITALVPMAKWQCIGALTYENLQWDDERPKPTKGALQDKLDELNSEWVKTEYQRLRFEQYPNVFKQLEALWDAMDSGELPKANKFYNMIKEVKEKFPKE